MTRIPGLMVMAYRCAAHCSLSRVNLFTVLRLSSLFHALILFFDYLATLLVLLICLWPFVAGTPTAGFQEVSMLCAANSNVNLFSVLRPRLFFRALIFLLGLPCDFPCPFNLSVAFRV